MQHGLITPDQRPNGWGGIPNEGYIAKPRPRAARGLKQFREDLFRLLVTRPILYWDDTVDMADRSRRISKRAWLKRGIRYCLRSDS